jgi:hypothetical protein
MKFQIAVYKSSLQTRRLEGMEYTASCRPFPWLNGDPLRTTGLTPEIAREKLIELVKLHSKIYFEELEVTDVEINLEKA